MWHTCLLLTSVLYLGLCNMLGTAVLSAALLRMTPLYASGPEREWNSKTPRTEAYKVPHGCTRGKSLFRQDACVSAASRSVLSLPPAKITLTPKPNPKPKHSAPVIHMCSVGGLDYGTVRAGAFMGLQMLSNLEDSLSRQNSYSPMAAKIGHSALENGNAHHAIGTHCLLTLTIEQKHALPAQARTSHIIPLLTSQMQCLPSRAH